MSTRARPLRLSWPADLARSAELRTGLRRWLDGQGVGIPAYDDAILVASELFANAVRASSRPDPIDVVVSERRGELVVEVSNTGPGFDPASLPPPAHGRPGGRGIAITRAVGALAVEQQGTRTKVTVSMALPPRGAGLPGG